MSGLTRPYTLFRLRRLLAAAAVASISLLAGACATSIRIPSLVSADVTGSIRAPVSPLSASLDHEDWRRAKGALAVALDPQGDGTPVDWDNPQTGAKGAILPVGDPYALGDRICRAFVAKLQGSVASPAVQGTGCRDGSGNWAVSDVKPWKS